MVSIWPWKVRGSIWSFWHELTSAGRGQLSSFFRKDPRGSIIEDYGVASTLGLYTLQRTQIQSIMDSLYKPGIPHQRCGLVSGSWMEESGSLGIYSLGVKPGSVRTTPESKGTLLKMPESMLYERLSQHTTATARTASHHVWRNNRLSARRRSRS